MKQRLLTMLLVMLLVLQSSGLLLAQDNGDDAGDGSAVSKVYLPLVNSGQAAVSTAEPGQVVVDFFPDTDETTIQQFYTEANNGDVQAAYTRGRHWRAKDFSPGPPIPPLPGAARQVGGDNPGQSLILTWSIIPDGTQMPPSGGVAGDTNCPSNLIATYNTRYVDGNGVPNWQPVIAQIFADWSAVSGLVFEREMGPTGTGFDDGAAWPFTKGEVGKRGDIRIGGCLINSIVAGYALTPNDGDIKLNTPNGVNFGLNSTFRVLLAHEIGHALGLLHACPDPLSGLNQPYRWLMHRFDTISNIGQVGPQHDDIRGIQRQYGDRFEKPENNNNSAPQATDLGTLTASAPFSLTTLSLDSTTDQDWFRFTATANQQIDLTLSPVGQTYPTAEETFSSTCEGAGVMINSQAMQNLGFEIRDANGTTIIVTANTNGPGLAESLSNVALGATPGTRYIRIFGAGTDDVQLYNLQVKISGSGSPTATPTNTPPPPTPTNTPLPPTATNTPLPPTPTNTPIPPTATNTPLPPTPTNTPIPPTATNTPVPPTPTPTNTATPAARACYWIESKLTGYVLDINGGNQNPGAQAIVWSKNVPDSANQLWYLNSDGTIESKLNGFVLDINGGNPAAGTNVIAWPRNTPMSNNQLWNQVDQGFLFYTIPSRLQGYLLALQNGSNAKGALVVTAPQGNPIPDSQKWKLNLATSATCAADLTAPWAKPSQSPAANANGWNNTDVTVTWNWSDLGGSGLNTATCPATSTSTGQGTITLRASCRDNAGNTGNASYTVKVDKTLPSINGTAGTAGLNTANLASNAEGVVAAAGNNRPWFKTDVQVDFACTDEGVEPAGLEINTVAGTTLTGEGAGQAVTNSGQCVDLAGNRAIPATVSEINIDKTAPVVACSANPNALWSPNHKLKNITATMNVNDPLSGAAGFTLVSVTSNEPDNGLGDGDTASDIQGWSVNTPDTAGQLRAERAGNGNGRIYTLTYQGADVAGNVAVCSTTVTVAHN